MTVISGLSNNGGGGLAAARHLAYYGGKVPVILLGYPSDIKTVDAKLQWKTLENFENIEKIVIAEKGDLTRVSGSIIKSDGIIDAIFGTGFSGKLREPYSSAIDLINSSKAFIISNDIPSGTDGDTGRILEKSVVPSLTVVLHKLKKGVSGKSIVVSIGILLMRKDKEKLFDGFNRCI